MDVKAIILVAGAAEEEAAAQFAETPLALTDIFGRAAVGHVVRHLKAQNVSEVAVISEAALPASADVRREQGVTYTMGQGAQVWRAAETAFNDLAQSGAEEIVVVRMGAYVEPDLDSFLQMHLDNGTHATRAVHRGKAVDLFVLTASRRNDAAYLFRHRLTETRTRCGQWRFRGYYNALETPQNLRCLAVDALLHENGIKPDAEEVRPGVWVARGAQIHPRARVLAPSYIGAHAKVRANALVTRCSVVEHHAEIDYGTVIEDATVLPYTYVGPGLDITRSVVGSCRVASLDRNVEVELADPRLLRALPASAGRRVLTQAASLATFLPTQVLRGFFSSTRHSKPSELPAAVKAPSSLNTPAGFPAASTALETSSLNRSWQ